MLILNMRGTELSLYSVCAKQIESKKSTKIKSTKIKIGANKSLTLALPLSLMYCRFYLALTLNILLYFNPHNWRTISMT